MDSLFIKIFNLGVTAGWLVLAILLCRPLMRRAPKWINCLLWGIVGFRLVFPFSLESIFSLIPSAETLPEDIMMTPTPTINSGIGAINNAINPILAESSAPVGIGTSINPMQLVVALASVIWVIGIALMLGYGIVSYISLRLKVRVSVRGEGKTYFCDEVDSPFILGVIAPRIYVPSSMGGEALDHVLAHELAHLRRGDPLWKPLGFAILAFYLFNPLLWVAYALLCRDIEAACDEKVIKEMSAEAKKSYSEALLACSLHRKRIMSCPLAFGEVGVKQRIKSVLNYKKPAFWIIIVALIATIVLSVCFLTNPVKMISDYLEPGSEWVCESDAIVAFGVEESGGIRGYVSFEGENYDVVFATRSAGLVRGTRRFVEIRKENANAVISETDVLLTGIMKKRGRDLVLEIQKDNLGLTEAELVFEKREDMGLVGTGGMHTSSVPPAEIGEDLFVYVIGYGTYSPDVGIELNGVRRDGDDVLFELQWTAKSENGCNIGPSFKVAMYLNGEPLKMVSYGAWEEIVTAIAGAGSTTCTYNITEHYNISEPGRYRFTCYDAWVEFQIVNTNYSAEAVYDTAVYDIDGDGRQEICEVSLGITSGAFTFTFRVSEPGEEAYEIYDVFYSDWMDFKFVLSDDGKLRLQGTTQGSEVRLYDIGIADGYVTLTNNGVPLTGLRQNNSIADVSVVFDPTYSHYDTSRKYDVYVWQMAGQSFSFGLLESKPRDWLDDELWDLKGGVSASEMRQILLNRNIGPSDVNIVHWQNPWSSFIGDFWVSYPYMTDNTPQEDLYYAMIYDMLFGTSPRNYYPTATETEWFDIDGDGSKETHTLFFGLVDGKFMFRYIISEDNKTASYDDTFYPSPMTLKFFTSDGKLRLRGVTEDGAAHIYDILLEGGHVKLVEIEAPHPEMADGKLDLSKADFSLVDRIVITNGSTGEKYYMSDLSNRTGFSELFKAIKTIKATDPVSSRGYYGFTYHVELYYDYQSVFSFSLCTEAGGASITCGYYETVGNFDYAARYKLTEPAYAKLDEVLSKYFK